MYKQSIPEPKHERDQAGLRQAQNAAKPAYTLGNHETTEMAFIGVDEAVYSCLTIGAASTGAGEKKCQKRHFFRKRSDRSQALQASTL